MIEEFLTKVCEELEIQVPQKEQDQTFNLIIGDTLKVSHKELTPGLYLHADICRCPITKRAQLLEYLMKANYLGQGSFGSIIGLDTAEKFLTLTLILQYEIDYEQYRENLESFVNALVYWREEIPEFLKQAKA